MGILADIEGFFESFFKGPATPDQKAKYLDHKVTTTNQRLDWRHSVVDLLTLMGQDSSLSARATLAKEFGHQGPFTGTADQNIWLHQKLMDNLKLAK